MSDLKFYKNKQMESNRLLLVLGWLLVTLSLNAETKYVLSDTTFMTAPAMGVDDNVNLVKQMIITAPRSA